MKKVSALVLAALLTTGAFVGCSSKEVSKPQAEAPKVEQKVTEQKATEQKPADVPVLRRYVVAKGVDTSKFTQEVKDNLQKFANSVNPEANKIDIVTTDAKYTDDGKLVFLAAITNTNNKQVSNMTTKLTFKTKDGQIIADGKFNLTAEQFGVIPQDTTMMVTLYFSPNDVLTKGADLSDYTVHSSTDWN
jgi:SLAP domain-containing protein